MPTCEEFYKGLNLQCNQILIESFRRDINVIHAKSHNFLGDINKWIELLHSRLELPLILSAQKEYQIGMLSLVQGQYRQAYMALRLFLEQALAGVYFSTNELELRRWLKGQQDIIWQSIINEDMGVFSKMFVEVFCPSLIDEAFVFHEMAKNLYRECSEYIHANMRTHKCLPQQLEYNEEVFKDWHERAETARMVVVFAFCVRYLDEYKHHPQKRDIEPTVMEYLSHISAIRMFFEGGF